MTPNVIGDELDQRSVLRYAMTSSISPGVSRNSGMLGWMPSAKGRCRSATAYLRCKVRNGGAFVSGLSLSCSMPWHCAQCKPTNLNPRRSAGGCSARAASIAHSRIRPSVIAGHGLRAGYFRAPFRSGVFGFACNSARHIRGHGPKWRSRGTTGNTNFDLHRRASPRPYLSPVLDCASRSTASGILPELIILWHRGS